MEILTRSSAPSPAAACSRATTGRIVFVSGAIPGERVRARVETRDAARRSGPRPIEVLEASPDRRVADLRSGVRRPRVRAHCLRTAARAEGRRRRGRVSAPRDASRSAARMCAVGVAGSAVTACARGCTSRDGRAGFFREGTHSCATPARPASLLPEAIAGRRCGRSRRSGSRAPSVDAVIVAENVAATERVAAPRAARGHAARRCSAHAGAARTA